MFLIVKCLCMLHDPFIWTEIQTVHILRFHIISVAIIHEACIGEDPENGHVS